MLRNRSFSDAGSAGGVCSRGVSGGVASAVSCSWYGERTPKPEPPTDVVYVVKLASSRADTRFRRASSENSMRRYELRDRDEGW